MTDTPANPPHEDDLPPGDRSCRAMVELACAMAIQDAVAYLRNTETVAVAVIGAAEEMAMNGINVQDAAATLTAAQASVTTAGAFLREIGDITTNILKAYPRD